MVTDRLCQLSQVSSLAMELVKFDTQKIQNPGISGVNKALNSE
ncbi:MAG: RRXRR domain-containing protein [Cyanobacteriota bacterium]|nr:RRXRR domain-containing protein [Cyanobacteriota bacterium]